MVLVPGLSEGGLIVKLFLVATSSGMGISASRIKGSSATGLENDHSEIFDGQSGADYISHHI